MRDRFDQRSDGLSRARAGFLAFQRKAEAPDLLAIDVRPAGCNAGIFRGRRGETEVPSSTSFRLSRSMPELSPEPFIVSCASEDARSNGAVRDAQACDHQPLPHASAPAKSSSRRSRATWRTRRGLVVSLQRFRLAPWSLHQFFRCADHWWFVPQLAAGILDFGPHGASAMCVQFHVST
jgi:hypothetical protein